MKMAAADEQTSMRAAYFQGSSATEGARPMTPEAAKARFLKPLGTAGLALDTLTPAASAEAVLAYYAEERADVRRLADDGDMLLFEWGTHDRGRGPAFDVSIGRQLIVADDEEDEPWPLDLRFRFEPSAGVRVGEGTGRWCASRGELAAFRRYVTGSRALAAVGQWPPVSVEFRCGRT
jgi:hypothetical protein